MQTHKISEIIEKIKALEAELEDEVQKRREEFFCDMVKKIAFKDQILADLREYCGLDTYAMVAIYEKLKEMVA